MITNQTTSRFILFLIGALCLSFAAQAGPATQPGSNASKKPHRILLLLDGSAAMNGPWKGYGTRYKLASQFMTGLAEEMNRRNSDVEFALRVYGHLFSPAMNVCNDTRREMAFSRENYGQLQARLNDIKPLGKGSVQFAFTEALANELADTARYQYSVIVVADSAAQCGGNCMKAPIPLFRKYLLQFGGAPARCYDSTFSADTATYRASFDHIINQYFPVEQNVFAARLADRDTVIVKNWAPDDVARREPDTAYGFPTIYNAGNAGNFFVYQRAEGQYRQVEEVFFNGARSKTLKVHPGVYKVAFISNGREHAKEFEVDHEMVIHIKLK